jgi:Fe-S oxidoreductase
MNPTAMIALIVAAHAAFFWSAARRWQLLRLGRFVVRWDQIPERIAVVWRYAFKQEKMDYYQPAGLAHKLIFVGFLVLTINTLVLWGRGVDPGFTFFILGPSSAVGKAYEFAKDLVMVGVLFGCASFAYFRVIKPQKRMTLHWEGLLILCIISTMMLSDMAYNGSSLVLAARQGELCAPGSGLATASQCEMVRKVIAPFGSGTEHELKYAVFPHPASMAFAMAFKSLSAGALLFIAQLGFWTHSTLVLIFLNLLPHSKHFHVITGIPNVFLKDMAPPGRLAPMAESGEKLMEIMGAVAEMPDPGGAPVGAGRIDHFTWKSILDFYTCTECGRCSDNCPAHRTGKVLSPKHLTLALRDHLYDHESELVETEMAWPPLPRTSTQAPAPATDDVSAAALAEQAELLAAQREGANAPVAYKPIDLVPNIVHPDVLWACTTCRACEEQCPVMISYVDKIVDMRRNLVLVKGEFPHQLQKPFEGMEVNGNPWNLSRMDRSAWSDGLGIPMMSEKPDAKVLYWVGCAASYDDRAKKIARAVAKLLKSAGVDFAILGQEENCTGDPARRAGNEFLFATLAEANAAVLNGYKEQGGAKTVITACPHCFNTLKNEYPDFGATLEVVHHTDFLMGLVAERKLVPRTPVRGKVVYHDSCYLGRYNDVYESPREILRSIPGVELVEAEYWNKQRGLCCGAGGAQMFMEEQNANRVNVKRTLQLIDTGAKTVASGCPFCMTMLTDGLKSQSLEDQIKQLDVAELLEQSCLSEAVPATVAPATEPAPQESAAHA